MPDASQPLGLVPVPDGMGGTILQMRALPPVKAKGKKGRVTPDPIEANPEASAQMLKNLLERVERLEEEKKGVNDDIRDVVSEAVAVGFDKKSFNALRAIRRLDPNERMEAEAILETYKCALGLM